MPVPSVFQRLPLHIAETIINAYVNHSEVLDDYDDTKGKIFLAWLTLYDVSHSWRTLALKHFCYNVELKISAGTEEYAFEFPCCPQGIEKSADLYRYVKHVIIMFQDIVKQPSERQHRLFSVAWPDNMVFPLARLLTISIGGELDQYLVDGATVQSKMFDWVAQRVLESLPRLQEANIEQAFDDYTDSLGLVMSPNQEMNSLFLTVFERVRILRLNASPICLVPNDHYCSNSSGIARLEYFCTYDVRFFHFIVQALSSTLETLVVSCFPMEYIQLFLFNDNGAPILYPKLERLEFHGFTSTEIYVRVDNQIAPFPALRYLKWQANYAFEDDTLFRGNNETLEYLDIGFSLKLVNLLQKEKVFTGGKYSKLCCIRANAVYDEFSGPATDNLVAALTADLISPAAQTFRTDSEYSYRDITNIFSECLYSENIKVLIMKRTTLSLLQVIKLVKTLPNMTDFMCILGRIDSEFVGCQIKIITDQLYNRFYPLSRRFKSWIAFRTADVPIKTLAISAIALAILCPNFSHTIVHDHDAESLKQAVESVIASGSHNEHADRLDGLFCFMPDVFFAKV